MTNDKINSIQKSFEYYLETISDPAEAAPFLEAVKTSIGALAAAGLNDQISPMLILLEFFEAAHMLQGLEKPGG
jgi:hypothetical protein